MAHQAQDGDSSSALPDDLQSLPLSRAGIANTDTGMPYEVKTQLPEDLWAEFVVKAGHGRSAVLRDLICMWVRGKTFDEHVAERKRERLYGPRRAFGGKGAGGTQA